MHYQPLTFVSKRKLSSPVLWWWYIYRQHKLRFNDLRNSFFSVEILNSKEKTILILNTRHFISTRVVHNKLKFKLGFHYVWVEFTCSHMEKPKLWRKSNQRAFADDHGDYNVWLPSSTIAFVDEEHFCPVRNSQFRERYHGIWTVKKKNMACTIGLLLRTFKRLV